MAEGTAMPSEGVWSVPQHHQTIWVRALAPGLPRPRAQGPASLSKDGVELLGDVALLGVLPLLASAHHHIGVCFAIGVGGSQVGSLGEQYVVELETVSLSKP